jgi:hypothetical protein
LTTTRRRQTSEEILLVGQANSEDRIVLEEQGRSYQHLSCTSPSLQLRIIQLVKKGN